MASRTCKTLSGKLKHGNVIINMWRLLEWWRSNQAKARTITEGVNQIIRSHLHGKLLEADPFKNPLVKRLYDEWLEHPGSEKAKRQMHPGYHRVVKSMTVQLEQLVKDFLTSGPVQHEKLPLLSLL